MYEIKYVKLDRLSMKTKIMSFICEKFEFGKQNLKIFIIS
jgi:hypothetical protein